VSQALETGQKVVIDLDFADYMRENEQKSICGQLAYTWHFNCAAAHPLHLVLTSVQVKGWAGRRGERAVWQDERWVGERVGGCPVTLPCPWRPNPAPVASIALLPLPAAHPQHPHPTSPRPQGKMKEIWDHHPPTT